MGKNIQKVQDMLDGNFKSKVQVGYSTAEKHRKVGDKWTDSDGYQWEQKEGFQVKTGNAPAVGLFSKQCKDCKQNCSKNNGDKRHYDTWVRFDRCFHCQINFEIDLKSKKFGENNNLWYFWVKLHTLQRWTAIDKEIGEYMETYWEEGKNMFDKSVVNAIANENLEGVKYEDIK
tara:strand:- start:378 stop:899 length:522 start_codon:yes stop_codon:yes gene_type:complete